LETQQKVKYKGIVLAGGSGTRLYPVTSGISKQLLPIYDKPMVYYPISVLMLADIKEILIISTPHDIENYKKLLGDGSQFGINLSYSVQEKPNGLAQAFLLGENFIGDDNVVLILGDNIFYGHNFANYLIETKKTNSGATVFAYHVSDPNRFGIVNFNKNGKVLTIEEKPKKPKSNYAVTGLYFYNNKVVEYAKSLKYSRRGELEITDLNNIYLSKKKLNVKLLSRGFAWLDTGTHETMMDASNFVQTVESRQGLKIACLEEIAFDKKWINKKNLKKLSKKYGNNNYGKYLESIIKIK
tara:strand:+ start:10 stop:903 length:894 start_codon:yes stop_codon:yes gene_type:complete